MPYCSIVVPLYTGYFLTHQCQFHLQGLSSRMMLIITDISSRVSTLSFFILSNCNVSNVSSRAGDCVTAFGCDSLFDTHVVVVPDTVVEYC